MESKKPKMIGNNKRNEDKIRMINKNTFFFIIIIKNVYIITMILNNINIYKY